VDAALRTLFSPIGDGITSVLVIGACAAIALFFRNSTEIRDSFSPTPAALVAMVCLTVISVLRMGLRSEFIYFQF
jgi:hypothetical protein